MTLTSYEPYSRPCDELRLSWNENKIQIHFIHSIIHLYKFSAKIKLLTTRTAWRKAVLLHQPFFSEKQNLKKNTIFLRDKAHIWLWNKCKFEIERNFVRLENDLSIEEWHLTGFQSYSICIGEWNITGFQMHLKDEWERSRPKNVSAGNLESVQPNEFAQSKKKWKKVWRTRHDVQKWGHNLCLGLLSKKSLMSEVNKPCLWKLFPPTYQIGNLRQQFHRNIENY